MLPPSPTTTLSSLVREELRATDLVFAMPYHVPRRRQADLAQPRGRAYFPPLPASVGLDTALHGTAFIEYPAIHVYARDEWDRSVRSGAVLVMPGLQPRRRVEGEDEVKVTEGERAPKRAKVEVNALAGLGDYGDSDEDDVEEGEGEGGEDVEGEEEGGEGTVDITLDPAMAAALGQALVADFGEAE